MATKVDPAVAKQRKQRMIVIFGGVILAGLLAFQGPKLMKQLHGPATSSSAAPATTTPTTTTPTTAPTTAPTTTQAGGVTSPAVSTGGTRGQAAEVAGVVIRPAGAPSAATGQLYSFSRFKAKDPFVPRVKDGSSSGSGTTGATSSPGAIGSPTGPVATPTTSSPAALGYATLMVNGKPQQLQLKQLFPKGQPTFVLLAVDKQSIRIGVAGGKFKGGGVVKLALGKPVTVMNTTTGQRFVMKLVFTGAQPEQIAGFNQQAGAPSGQTAATSTQTTTTASTP